MTIFKTYRKTIKILGHTSLHIPTFGTHPLEMADLHPEFWIFPQCATIDEDKFLQSKNKGHSWDKTSQYLGKFLGLTGPNNSLSLIKDIACNLTVSLLGCCNLVFSQVVNNILSWSSRLICPSILWSLLGSSIYNVQIPVDVVVDCRDPCRWGPGRGGGPYSPAARSLAVAGLVTSRRWWYGEKGEGLKLSIF